MKKYIVMIDYGLEGWKIHHETDDFQEAFKMREEALSYSSRVQIFTPVSFIVTEESK